MRTLRCLPKRYKCASCPCKWIDLRPTKTDGVRHVYSSVHLARTKDLNQQDCVTYLTEQPSPFFLVSTRSRVYSPRGLRLEGEPSREQSSTTATKGG